MTSCQGLIINNYNDYRQAVDNNLQLSWEAVKCNNIQCTNSAAHCTEPQLFHDRIIHCCKNACEETIAYTGDTERSHAGLSGWNKHVREHRGSFISSGITYGRTVVLQEMGLLQMS